MVKKIGMLVRTLCLVFAGMLPWESWAGGAEKILDLLDCPVSYSASYRATDGKGVFVGKVWHEQGRERRDFDLKGSQQTLLLRRDQEAAYLIRPESKFYLAVGFHAAFALAGGLDGIEVTRRPMGNEVVDGLKTIRTHLVASNKDGRSFDGDLWTLASGVPVKIAGIETEPDGKKNTVELVQSAIRIGPTPQGQLDVPSGFMGINLKKISAENLAQALQSMGPLLGGKK